MPREVSSLRTGRGSPEEMIERRLKEPINTVVDPLRPREVQIVPIRFAVEDGCEEIDVASNR